MLAVCALALSASCKRVSERTLLDSEGRAFSAKCDRAGECQLAQRAGPLRGHGRSDLTLTRTGRLVGICDVTPGQTPENPSDCRPLVCQSDADCPPGHGLKNGQCLNALCTDAAQALGPSDSVMLCLAGSGLGREEPRQIDRYALGLNCGNPCKVPAPCRQP